MKERHASDLLSCTLHERLGDADITTLLAEKAKLINCTSRYMKRHVQTQITKILCRMFDSIYLLVDSTCMEKEVKRRMAGVTYVRSS